MATRTRQSTLRPPPSSPSLAALLEVEPPSPILSPSDLPPSRTSGEIPILLFDSSHATAALPDEQDQSLFSTPISNPRTCRFSSKPKLRVAGFESGGCPPLSTGICLEHVVETDLAFDIFGRRKLKSEKERRLSLCWSSSLSTGDFIRDGIDTPEQSPNASERESELYNDSWLDTRNWNDFSKPSGIEIYPENSGEEHPSPWLQRGPHSDTIGTLYIQDSRLADAPLENYSLVMYASPPASSSNLNHHKRSYSVPATRGYPISGFGSGEVTLIDSCVGEASSTQDTAALGWNSSLSTSPAIHVAFPSPTLRKELHDLVPRDTSLSGSQPQIVLGDRDTGRISTGSTNDGFPDIHASSMGEKFYSSLSSYIPRHLEFPFFQSPQSRSAKPKATSQSSLRCNYPWLQNVTVGLVIDQEGFRSIEPTFEKVGIRRVCLESGNKDLDVAMFAPTTKQAYRFHYAPFEGLPILRRLIINGDESHDFLSRQAYLGLKSSGMYIVHGTEVASSAAGASESSVDDALEIPHAGGRTQEQSKLYWCFEYCIEDRKADQPGRSLDGERVLIPLMFTCSPGLVHPSQGKKIKLIHIVKKSVTPKLVAERRQQFYRHSETRIAALSASRAPFPPKTSVGNRPAQQHYAKSQARNSHRRSQSNPRLPDVRAKISLDSSLKGDPSNSTRVDSDSKSTHRRRASSVEAHTGPRFIIPPSRLRQLLEEDRNDHDTQGGRSFNKPVSSHPSDFFPLKPSPKFVVHR